MRKVEAFLSDVKRGRLLVVIFKPVEIDELFPRGVSSEGGVAVL